MNTPLTITTITPEILSIANSAENLPHRHDYHEIIILSRGTTIHEIDGEELSIPSPSALLIAQGKIHRIVPDTVSRGWVLRFSDEYLPPESSALFSQFINNSNLSLADDHLKATVFTLTGLLNDASSCTVSNVPRHLLAALLSLLSEENRRIASVSHTVNNTDYALFHRFLELLDKKYSSEKRVEFYASHLGVTAKKLNTLCRAMFEKTTSQIIESRCIIQAKRLLMYTGENVQQIAYTLGYDDHSYFSKLFKKATGLSPSDFRTKHVA